MSDTPSELPSGTPCYLRLDDGSEIETRTRSDPWTAGGRRIQSVDGKTGGWDTRRIRVRADDTTTPSGDIARSETYDEAAAALYCTKPDRDFSETICGYPLPCPWHTVVIHADKEPPTVEIPATAAPLMNRETLGKLKQIARIIDDA